MHFKSGSWFWREEKGGFGVSSLSVRLRSTGMMLGAAASPPAQDRPQHVLVLAWPRAPALSPHTMPSPVAGTGGAHEALGPSCQPRRALRTAGSSQRGDGCTQEEDVPGGDAPNPETLVSPPSPSQGIQKWTGNGSGLAVLVWGQLSAGRCMPLPAPVPWVPVPRRSRWAQTLAELCLGSASRVHWCGKMSRGGL